MANAGADKPARIFRDYDQAALDRELNLRGRWPEHGRFFERWARDSAAVRERLPARLDLAYGDTPAEALDLFPVPGTTAAPLLADRKSTSLNSSPSCATRMTSSA